jgi:hypothetical protein
MPMKRLMYLIANKRTTPLKKNLRKNKMSSHPFQRKRWTAKLQEGRHLEEPLDVVVIEPKTAKIEIIKKTEEETVLGGDHLVGVKDAEEVAEGIDPATLIAVEGIMHEKLENVHQHLLQRLRMVILQKMVVQ